MTITPLNLLLLKSSLQSIDTFKFDAKTTYTLSRNLNWVEAEIKPLESTRKKISEEFGNPNATNPKFKDYLEKWEEFVNIPIEVKDLRLIDYKDLNIGNETNENAIPVRVLNGLFPIINEEIEPKKTKK